MSPTTNESSRLKQAAQQLLREAPAAGVPFEKGAPFPLDYGREEAASSIARRDARVVFHRIGGLRQLVFAAGMACALGGLGLAVTGSLGEGPLCMSVGGVLIGLAIPLGRR
jgi:hypothetical protein